MLIITRRPKKDENNKFSPHSRIIIDGGITITIMEVKGNHVKIGVEAPKGIGVYREERLEEDQGDND